MTAHVHRFDGLAAAYDRFREDYPPALFAAILAAAPAGPALVADVGAGTGLSTARLLGAAPAGWRVLAFEPGADMRGVLSARFAGEPRVTIIDAPGEAIPVADGALAAITVCAAFHWLDAPRFLAEARRALAPGGALAVVRNRRVAGAALEAMGEWLREQGERAAPWRQSVEDQAAILGAAAGFGPVTRVVEPWSRTLDAEAAAQLALTRSTAKPVLERLGRAAVERALRAICAESAGDGPVRLDYEATALIVRRADPAEHRP